MTDPIANDNLKSVSLFQIRENPIALRTVNRESEKYLGLVESMRQRGFFGALTVREKNEDGLTFYELVDGLHRYSAAKDAGLTSVNVNVVSLADDEALVTQVLMNIHHIETSPMEYTAQLKRILNSHPLMTENDLATALGKSKAWIIERLNLLRIDDPEIKALVDSGAINLSNAYALAKLPSGEMRNFIEDAQTLPPSEFIPKVNLRAKEIKEANRKGKEVSNVFSPVAFLQKTGAIKAELETGAAARKLITTNNITDPVDAALMMLKWVLHLDPESVEVQKAKDDARKEEALQKKKEIADRKAAKTAEKGKE